MTRLYLSLIAGLVSAAVMAGWVFSGGQSPLFPILAACCFFTALGLPVVSDLMNIGAGFDRLVDDQRQNNPKKGDQQIIPPKPLARQFWQQPRPRTLLIALIGACGWALLLVGVVQDILS